MSKFGGMGIGGGFYIGPSSHQSTRDGTARGCERDCEREGEIMSFALEWGPLGAAEGRGEMWELLTANGNGNNISVDCRNPYRAFGGAFK
jgi:hypothetical protein